FERWREPRSWAMPAVAAVVVAFLGFAGVILSSTRSTDNPTTFAGPALDARTEAAVPGAPDAPVGDLGDVADAAMLRARALGTASAGAAGRSSSSANSGATSGASGPAASNTGTLPPNVSSGASGAENFTAGGAPGLAGPTPKAVGTRPCEERARNREPSLGPVTYFATARRGGVPAYVLGFSSPSGSVTLLLLAQDGCSELLRSAGP
ncbi:MAG: hypothetical protein ACR2HM_02885, partial [Acidimicrobiales bacterium]